MGVQVRAVRPHFDCAQHELTAGLLNIKLLVLLHSSFLSCMNKSSHFEQD